MGCIEGEVRLAKMEDKRLREGERERDFGSRNGEKGMSFI